MYHTLTMLSIFIPQLVVIVDGIRNIVKGNFSIGIIECYLILQVVG